MHVAHGRPSELGRARERPARARRALVELGRLRLADERRRSGGRARAADDLRLDGRPPRRGALRARCVRRRRAAFRRVAYGVVRTAQIALFTIASRDDPALRRSVVGLAGSTAIGVSLLVAAPAPTAGCRERCGRSPSCSTWVGRILFGSEGWKLVPGHFAERHGLIVLIALGESIVAIGVGSGTIVDAGVVSRPSSASCSRLRSGGSTSTSRRSAPSTTSETPPSVASRTSSRATRTRYLHFPMVAGIVLVALGLKKTLAALRRVARARPDDGARRRRLPLPRGVARLSLAQPSDGRSRPLRLRGRDPRADPAALAARLACDPSASSPVRSSSSSASRSFATPSRASASAERSTADVIRELAANPNVHTPLGRRLRARHRPRRPLRRLPRARHERPLSDGAARSSRCRRCRGLGRRREGAPDRTRAAGCRVGAR